MKCKSNFKNGAWTFNFKAEPELGDGDFSNKVRFSRESFVIEMPKGFNPDDVHPDLYGLAVLLSVYPFVGKRIELDKAVSPVFANAFKKLSNKSISPIDEGIEVRKPPSHSVPGLAFSGGVDSTAALTLLPASTVAIFLERIIPEGVKTIYRKDAAKFSVEELRKAGRAVHSIRTDLEYLRDPVGFPVDVSNSVPAILLADHIGLDSIAFGTILESAYRVGHEKYVDYAVRSHYIRWGTLFEISGVPFNLVTSGISEVGTSKIVLESEFGYLAQSCMRGGVRNPCFNCWKCFRKLLLDRVLSGEPIPDDLLDKAFSIKEAKKFLSKDFIKHQNVIEFISSMYSGNHKGMRLLADKVCNNHNISMYKKWYSKSVKFIPAQYREHVTQKISRYLDIMSPKEEKAIEDYNLEEILSSDSYKTASDKFANYLLQ
ncbi:DUF6395 domain-containing protein [Microbulbifer thermotolerans]|uniref:DUF6395 domain-containing protein n=1 Tax=Microbulbifer thermotolerans TaxID=252514 RepID=UPI00224B965B|nr:DUF6395 domain-containing protein [Microbulbifer thermotolerans]MCX2840252.1 DUF6395 domain-containing protein [Microbulbifer thermotolerans]